jgi:hypothetical protein
MFLISRNLFYTIIAKVKKVKDFFILLKSKGIGKVKLIALLQFLLILIKTHQF